MRINEELMEIWPNEVCDKNPLPLGGKTLLLELHLSMPTDLQSTPSAALSQTSFGHISINSSSILMVSMATESP